MDRAKNTCLWVALLALLHLSCGGPGNEYVRGEEESPRNVILFIADGAGVGHFTMGREFARHIGIRNSLYLDAHQSGSVQTHSAKERVTDSASSATAFASGVKTYNGAIGVDTLRRSLPTVIDAAERLGMATGIVVTSRTTHATPASFSAHVEDRWMEAEIADQQIRNEIDVIIGGGRRYFLPESAGGDREDGRNLLDDARDLGYHVVQTYEDLQKTNEIPVLGVLTRDHLPYAIDREPNHPDLAALTQKALELLNTDEDGFFLMVEGSRIDHASHDNDPAAAVHDVLDYDEAFHVALQFAQEAGNTLVIAVSDHETGGLSLGRGVPPDSIPEGGYEAPTYWRSLYGNAVYAWRPDVLARVGSSAERMADAIAKDDANIRDVMSELAGINDLNDEELLALSVARKRGQRLRLVIGEIIGRRALVGWTTEGHTAEDVNLYAFGPGSKPLHGSIDNTAIGRHIFSVLGVGPELISERPAVTE